MKDKKSICNAFNKVFSGMGFYKGQVVPLNVEKPERTFEVQLETFFFTLREIYKIIDNLDNNKAPCPGFINSWALKSGKYAIRTHLQLIFNDCIQENVLATIHQNGALPVLTNYCPISVTPTFEKFSKNVLNNQLVDYLEKI